MNIEQIKQKVLKAIDRLYREEKFLFEENLCERCINHRFAICLEKQNFGEDYFIDCEYNKSHIGENSVIKKVSNLKGNYIDIVITKRNKDYTDNLICFETKKWNNKNKADKNNKDRKNLKILTNIRFEYKCGFYIIFGETKKDILIEVYEFGMLKEVIKFNDSQCQYVFLCEAS